MKESHSYVGLPGDGFKPVAEKYDWMVRARLVSDPSKVKNRPGATLGRPAPAPANGSKSRPRAIASGAIPAGSMRLSHVGDTSEDKRSLGGSGHAVAFDRPEKARSIVAIQIYASRYGLPEPPKEDFHVRLLDKDRKVLQDFPFPYAKIARGPMRWYTLDVPATEVPEHFYVALSFNPEQTKGIYLGLDKNVKESHSYVGLPEEGFQPVRKSPIGWSAYTWRRLRQRAFAADSKLTEAEQLFCQWDAKTFGLPDPARWNSLTRREKAAAEDKFIKQLSSDEEKERVEAIDALAALGSKKAVPAILQIAADRKEKNNWDRHTACRALGMLGDSSVVPELVHLTYHYNWNTRQWAQISLVRLTGQNFGRDVAAWRQWWEKQGGKPPISGETVAWATSPQLLSALKGGRPKAAGGARPPGHGDDNQGSQAADRHPHAIQRRQGRGPGLAQIRVTFDVPMAKGFSWTGGGPQFPKLPEGKKPSWSEDRKTCVLPVELEPGRYYRLGLNSQSFKKFPERGGRSLGARGILVQNAQPVIRRSTYKESKC